MSKPTPSTNVHDFTKYWLKFVCASQNCQLGTGYATLHCQILVVHCHEQVNIHAVLHSHTVLKHGKRTVKENICYSAPKYRHCHRRGTRVHSTHQAASHILALNLPSCSQYSFTDPGCKEQLAHGCYVTARGQQDSNPRPCSRWSSTLPLGYRVIVLRNRRWGGCVYVLQMFFVFFCSPQKYQTTILGNGWTDFHETFTKR